MAIMAVKIDDRATLSMNEFFDYNGWCFGISRSRACGREECANLEDFYECTVLTDWVEDVPVVFIEQDETKAYITGWYKNARIYRNIRWYALFMEGNIESKATDVVLLPEAERKPWTTFNFSEKNYEVIEYDDQRHDQLVDYIDHYCGKTIPVTYATVDNPVDRKKVRSAAAGIRDRQQAAKASAAVCIDACQHYAGRLMEDHCESISELKALYEYAQMAVTYDSKLTDGYYYQAMACEHLGFLKKGIKAIERALLLEPLADDLLGQKGNLLANMKQFEKALSCYEKAFEIDFDEDYLIMMGKTYGLMGKMEEAGKTFERVIHKERLADHGIDLSDINRRWPFAGIRGLRQRRGWR